MGSKDNRSHRITGRPSRRDDNSGKRRHANSKGSGGPGPVNDARLGAAFVLDKFESGKSVSFEMEYFASRARMDVLNRSLMKKLVSGVLQNKTLLDFRINELLVKKRSKLPVTLRNILRTAIYQILFLDGIPEWASVSEAVRLAGETGFPRLKGLTNGVLRSILRSGITEESTLDGITPGTAEYLAVRFSHPQWLVERWIGQFGRKETAELLKWNNLTPPVTFQVNTLRLSPGEFLNELETLGVVANRSKPGETGFNVTGRMDMRLLESFRRGGIYVQDDSGAMISRMYPVDPSLSIVDLCAAPGGKVISAAINRKDGGKIIACDLEAARINTLKENIRRLRLGSVVPLVADGLLFPGTGGFDVVLVDTPCSGSGTLRRKADLRWRITPSWLENLSLLQNSLLESAASLVVSGGRIIYSTCSLETEENTGAIDLFLEKHRKFRIEHPPSVDISRFTRENGTVQFLPHRDGCDGAFAAILRCA